jgi:tetratricopeptide (TPR) repeat protein
MWNLILARVWSGASSDVCEAGERLLDLLEQAEEPGPEAAGAIAQMIARACLNASNAAEAEKLLKVLERLSVASPATVRRFYRLGVTAGARLRSQDEGTREQARQQAARLAKSDPGNGAIALLLSQMHLEEGDLESAIAALQQASPEDELERELCSHLSDLLGGNSPTVDKLPRAFQDDSRGAAPSVALLKAAVAFASQASEQGYEALLASLGGRAEEAASVINVARLAPTLCAQSSRSAVPPALVEIIKRMVDRPGDEEEMLRLARCAAAIGEPAAACRLWERALAAYRQPEAALRQEYAAYLCHLAVAAKNSGKPSDAARSLRGAASIAAGGSKGA